MSDNPLNYGTPYADPNNPLNDLDRVNALALGPLYAARNAATPGSAGASSVSPQVPKQFSDAATAQAKAEGMRFVDATGLHFLDGDKPVYAWNGADPTPVLGSRASELNDHASVTGGPYTVWYKPGEKARAQQVLSLSQLVSSTDPKSPYLPSYDQALGLALGYPADNVARYIQQKYSGNK